MNAKIEIKTVIVGEPIEIEVVFSDNDNAGTVFSGSRELPVQVIARYRSLTRHQIETTLRVDPDNLYRYTGAVKTSGGTSIQPGSKNQILRVRAKDTVTVQLEDDSTEQTVALGLSAEDIIVGQTATVLLIDEDEDPKRIRQVVAKIKPAVAERKPSIYTLAPKKDRPNQFSVSIETDGTDDGDGGENTIAVQEKEKVEFTYERPDGKLLSWQVNTYAEKQVDLQVTGRVSPGKPIEVSVADPDRADDFAVSISVFNHRTEKIVDQQLKRIEGLPWKFLGIVHTFHKPMKGRVTVQEKDTLDVFYLDAKNAFHRTAIDILEPPEEIINLPWQKKYCRRAFLMPSLKPLLAELNCLEVRLSYYRSTATRISECHRADLLERSLQRANRTLNDTKWDLTPAWEAFHDAKRQEVYLLSDTEAEGEASIVAADSKEMVGPDHQKKIKELLEQSALHRKRQPATERWRGFIVSAMKMLHEQQDTYFIRQNMVRDRMVLMTIFLVVFLTLFFSIQWGSRISTALVNNRTITSIFTAHSPLASKFPGLVDEKDVAIHFIGETIVGQPLMLAVFDPDAESKLSVNAKLSCTAETASLCPKMGDSFNLKKVSDEKGWYRYILPTKTVDATGQNPGAMVFQPGAEIIATYEKKEQNGDTGVKPFTAKTRMLDPQWFPKIDLSYGGIIFASCLLGAIGACLSTLMDLKSGSTLPNFKDSIMVSVVRPVIGFTAALLLFISINAKLLNFEPTLTMFWLLCFVSGFSDKYVLGIVGKIDSSGKEKK